MQDELKALETTIDNLEKAVDRLPQQDIMDELYKVAWNSALEIAAFKIEHDFVSSFGKDTLSSVAIYLREMKK